MFEDFLESFDHIFLLAPDLLMLYVISIMFSTCIDCCKTTFEEKDRNYFMLTVQYTPLLLDRKRKQIYCMVRTVILTVKVRNSDTADIMARNFTIGTRILYV